MTCIVFCCDPYLNSITRAANTVVKAVSDNKSHSNIYYWAADIVAYVQLAIQLILRTSTLKKQYRNEIEKITGREYWINKLK